MIVNGQQTSCGPYFIARVVEFILSSIINLFTFES